MVDEPSEEASRWVALNSKSFFSEWPSFGVYDKMSGTTITIVWIRMITLTQFF
jgi:hypothetical protein